MVARAPARSPSQLILTVTRECNLRCSYCPTAKDGWPSLSEDDARRALDVFVTAFGGGGVKLFGGEPLLVPDVVRAAIKHAARLPQIRSVQLSTNGLGLDDAWLETIAAHEKVILQLSLDGRPEDHRRHRRALPQAADSYDHVRQLAPRLSRMPRVVITQTIAPAAAKHAADNFAHILELGFTRVNFLPGYYLPWNEGQLEELEDGFAEIASLIEARWARGQRFYVRNLTTRAPTPFFNSGMVVDSDRTIHPSNVGLSGSLEELLGKTRCGDLDDPPSAEVLEAKQREVNGWLEQTLAPHVWDSTMAVDAALTRFCRRLTPRWVASRRAREVA